MTFQSETQLIANLLSDLDATCNLLVRTRGVRLARTSVVLTVHDRELLGALSELLGAKRWTQVDGPRKPAPFADVDVLAVDRVAVKRPGVVLEVHAEPRLATADELTQWELGGRVPLRIEVGGVL